VAPDQGLVFKKFLTPGRMWLRKNTQNPAGVDSISWIHGHLWCKPEMSIGLDLDWTGSRLWRILLNLDLNRTVIYLINLGPGLDLDWDNGKICVIFIVEKLYFVHHLDFIWTWTCGIPLCPLGQFRKSTG